MTEQTILTDDELDGIAAQWRRLNAVLGTLSREDVKRMLDREMRGLRRKSVVVRLHQRYTMLRAESERAVILAELSKAPAIPSFLTGV